MAHVSVTINGRSYQIACDDGQENHLRRLARYVDKRVGELAAAVGQVGDARLMVMASLLVADELSDVYSELETLRKNDGSAAARADAEDTMAQVIDALAKRIEDIAEIVERS